MNTQTVEYKGYKITPDAVCVGISKGNILIDVAETTAAAKGMIDLAESQSSGAVIKWLGND